MATYQDLSDLAGHGMALPGLDDDTKATWLREAAAGEPQDVVLWLNAGTQPAEPCLDDAELLAMCAAFGLL